jgi:hypothetical protein
MLDTEQSDKNDLQETAGDDRLFCAQCHATLTRQRFAIERRDAHQHTVFNPAGHVFTLLCFVHAPGAGMLGKPSTQFSWFPDYSWRIALCIECGTHIGWEFTGADTFYGLIKPALIKSPDQKS